MPDEACLVPRFHKPIWNQHIEECTVVKHDFYSKEQSTSATVGLYFSVSKTSPALVLKRSLENISEALVRWQLLVRYV